MLSCGQSFATSSGSTQRELTPRIWFGPPTVPVYAREVDETLKPFVVVAYVMVSVTGSVLAVAPGADTVTVVE